MRVYRLGPHWLGPFASSWKYSLTNAVSPVPSRYAAQATGVRHGPSQYQLAPSSLKLDASEIRPFSSRLCASVKSPSSNRLARMPGRSWLSRYA